MMAKSPASCTNMGLPSSFPDSRRAHHSLPGQSPIRMVKMITKHQGVYVSEAPDAEVDATASSSPS